MDRRTFVKGAGAAITSASMAAPAFAQSARSRTLILVPGDPFAVIDPLVSGTPATIAYGYHVFDQLYGVDSQYRPHPQMVEGHTVSDDGLTWTFRLRPGQKFHDGEPVRSNDCVASIRRWGKRDVYLQSLMNYTDALDIVDDRTFRFRLKKRFPILEALAHPHSTPLLIMPERMAMTDATKPVTEAIGSGPYRFLRDEFLPSQKAAFVRNDAYIPRSEKADVLSGGKIANFERVEWRIIGDSQTATSALITGEIDWLQVVAPDLIPLLKKEPTVKLEVTDPSGLYSMLRFNTLQPPFNNVKVRQIVLEAMSQDDYNTALMGDNADLQKTCYAFFSCNVPGVKQVAEKIMTAKKDFPRLREELKQAGYNGEKVVILNQADRVVLTPLGAVCADVMQKLGMNVDLQTNDNSTFMARRTSKETIAKGGWNIFHSSVTPTNLVDPVVNLLIRGIGPTGFPGWYDSPRVERLVDEWIAGATTEAREETLNKIQLVLLEEVPSIMMGNIISLSGFRKNLEGFLPGPLPVPWGLKRV